MENQILDSGLSKSESLVLNSTAKDYLFQTAKWAKFLAIFGIIFSFLIMVLGFFMPKIFSMSAATSDAAPMPPFMNGVLVVLYIVIGLIMLYPSVRLLQFSKSAKLAVDMNDSVAIEESLKRLRSVFRFYGILTIMVLSLYALAFLMVIFGGSAFK